MTDESRLCLLATIMDYSHLSDHERTIYLNTYGPNKDNNVCEKTVNNELNKLDFHIKSSAFSPKERNTLGYLIARYLWGNVISDIMQNKKVITCFVDEAGVKKSPPKNSRGYLSITPVVTDNFSNYNIATILTAVGLGFGNFSRWFEVSVTSIEYARFIREISFIIRTKICKNDNQIIIINDNASIHKTKDVFDAVDDNKINFFITVAYSSQTYLPPENYFSRMKFALLFENFIKEDDEIQMTTTEGFYINDDKTEDNRLPVLLNGTSFHHIIIQNIVQ